MATATAPAKAAPTPVGGVTSLSPAEFAHSSLFATEYPFFGRLSVGFLAAFLVLLGALLGLSPPSTDSAVRSVMHYAGYAIFVVMWAQIHAMAKKVLSDTAVNNAIAVFATQRIDAARKDMMTGRRLKVEDLQQFIPANTSEPAMFRLLVRIWQDATSWRFDSLTSLIAPYQRESLALKVRLENLQRAALRLGILGAFVGLMLALKDLQQLASSGPDSLVQMDKFLPGFLGALYLKFGASIGGLGASLYGFAMTAVAEKKQALYFRNMEAAASSLVDLAARSLRFSAFVDEFGMIRSSIKDVQNEVHDQVRKTADLAEGVGKLAQLGTNIGQFTSSLEKEHSKFLTDMQRLYDQASMERVFKNLEATVIAINKQNQEAIGQQFRAGLGAVDRDFGEVRSTLRAVERSVARVYVWTVAVVGSVGAGGFVVWFLFRH